MSEDVSVAPKPRKKPDRIGLFAPAVVVLIASAGWTGYWFYTADAIEKALKVQTDGLIKQGYQVTSDPYHVTGFPYRMAVDFKNLTIIAKSGRGVMFPLLEARANAYALDKWVMVAPDGLTLYRGLSSGTMAGGYNLGKLTVTGTTLRASVSGLNKPIPTIALQGTEISLVPSDPAHPFTFETAELFEAYVRPNMIDAAGPGAEAGAKTVSTDSADWLFRVAGAHGQPQGFVGKFSPGKPLDMHIEGTFTKMSVFRNVDFATGLKAWKAGGVASGFKCQLKNGDLEVLATSDALGSDANSRLTGRMKVDMSGTFRPLDVLAGAGLISDDNMTLAAPLLNMKLSTVGPQTFNIDFHDGGAYMGPLKISDAPVLP